MRGVIGVRCRQVQAAMRATIDVMSASQPSVDAALLITNSANVNCWSQSSLWPSAYACSVLPITSLASSTLALVFLWYAEPTISLVGSNPCSSRRPGKPRS